MGWNPFKSKKKISVASSTVNLAGDKKKPIFMREVIFNATMQGRDYPNSIVNSLIQGPGNKLRKYYRYGRDHYTQGLPRGSVTVPKADSSKCIEVVQNQVAGGPIEVIQFDVGMPDPDYWVMEYLTDTYGYDPDTGLITSTPPGVSPDAEFMYQIDKASASSREVVNLYFTNPGTDVEIVVPTTIDTNNWSSAYTYCMLAYRTILSTQTTSSTEERARLDTDKEGEVSTTVKMVNADASMEYRTTKVTTEFYEETDIVTGDIKLFTRIITVISIKPMKDPDYFMYHVGSGLYPELDNYYGLAGNKPTSDYFPIVFFREWNTDLFHPNYKNSARYKSATKLLKTVSISAQEMRKSINANPDIGEVDHAYLVIGVPINSPEQASKRYLFEYFKAIAPRLSITKNDFLYGPAWMRNTKNTIQMQQDTYDIAIRLNFADHTTKRGNIGRIGHCTVEKGNQTEEIIWEEPIYDTNGKQIGGGAVGTRTYGAIFIKKQVSDTHYEQMEIVGLEHTNYIYKGKSVGISGWDALNDPKETKFLIPLLYSIQQKVNLAKFTQVSTDCYHMVFNSYKVTKIKWYQSGIFKAITVVIAIVVTVYSAGAFAAGLSAAVAAATAAGTSVIAAVTTYIGSQLLLAVALGVGMNILGSVIGAEGMFLLAAIASVYVMSSWGSAQLSSAPGAQTGLPFADEILAVVPAIIKGGEQDLQRSFAQLRKEMREFEQFTETKNKEMEEAWEELYQDPSGLNYQRFIESSYIRLFETPELFFGRTLNPTAGTMSTDMVGLFVPNALQLPRGIQ